MTEEKIIEKLTEVFRSAFKNQELIVYPELSPNDVLNWNSLNNTVMLHEIEKVFNIRLGFTDIINIQNVGDIIELIKTKVAVH